MAISFVSALPVFNAGIFWEEGEEGHRPPHSLDTQILALHNDYEVDVLIRSNRFFQQRWELLRGATTVTIFFPLLPLISINQNSHSNGNNNMKQTNKIIVFESAVDTVNYSFKDTFTIILRCYKCPHHKKGLFWGEEDFVTSKHFLIVKTQSQACKSCFPQLAFTPLLKQFLSFFLLCPIKFIYY